MNEGNGGFSPDDYRGRLFYGKGKSVEEAASDAYEKAKGHQKQPPFRVKQMWVDGNNPITDYIIEIESSH